MGCLIFLLGGFLAAIFFEGSRFRRIQCRRCGHIFRQPFVPKSPVERFACAIVAVLLVLGCFAALAFQFPGIGASLPEIPFGAALEKAVLGQPRVAAYLLAFLFLVLPTCCLVVAMVASIRSRKRLASAYELRVSPASFPPPERDPSGEAPPSGVSLDTDRETKP
jgi:uncharacterized paraquat-inducible protein A